MRSWQSETVIVICYMEGIWCWSAHLYATVKNTCGISFFLSSYRRLILWSWAHPSQKRFPFLGFSRELLFSTVRMTFYQVNGFRLVPGHDQNRRDCYEQGSPYSERVCSWNDGHCQHRNTVKMTAFSVTYIGTILSGKERPRCQLR